MKSDILNLDCRNHQGLYFQASFLDCNGVTILSKHPILNTITVPFNKRIDTLNERFVARGFTAATILVMLFPF